MPSTVVTNIEYKHVEKILRITFLSGAIYDYLNVSEETYLDMKNAFSKGEYLNTHIKNQFEFRRVR